MIEKVTNKRRVTASDWVTVADYICEEYRRRKDDRKDLEKQWNEIDRQLRMEPSITHKLLPDGRQDPKKAWMPEMELPNQAQTLETLTADSRRMKFPDSGAYFSVHAALTDEYLERVEFQALIEGDENDVPSRITQDNANKLTQGVVRHWHHQYDFDSVHDQIDAEAFKYGVGIGRMRVAEKRVFTRTARGVVKESQEIPVLIARSLKETYLDDRAFAMMGEGHVVSPAYIFEKVQRIEDLRLAAKGSNDPENLRGGWMAKSLENLMPDDHGNIHLLEYEGDLIISRKTRDSLYIPNCIVTVAVGKSDKKAAARVVRFRFLDIPFSSVIEHPYHIESLSTPYATSPLMKGMPIQKAAADALNRLMMTAALNCQPPIRYDGDDHEFIKRGGPMAYPGAQWPTLGNVETVEIGDMGAMLQVYAALLAQYADVTGVNAPRLGAQTISHTTAYAKEAELTRGTVRTVDYVRTCIKGPMTTHLEREFAMGRKAFKEATIFIPEYGGFARVMQKHLPDIVTFEVFGSGGPAEEMQKKQNRLAAATLALQIDAEAITLGAPPTLDRAKMINQVLREGGWTDVDALTSTPSAPATIGGGSGLAGLPVEPGTTGDPALEAGTEV